MSEISHHRKVALVNIAATLTIENVKPVIDVGSWAHFSNIDSSVIEYIYGSNNKITISYSADHNTKLNMIEISSVLASHMILRQEFWKVSKFVEIYRSGKRRLHASIDHLGVTKIYRFEDGPWAYELIRATET